MSVCTKIRKYRVSIILASKLDASLSLSLLPITWLGREPNTAFNIFQQEKLTLKFGASQEQSFSELTQKKWEKERE